MLEKMKNRQKTHKWGKMYVHCWKEKKKEMSGLGGRTVVRGGKKKNVCLLLPNENLTRK